jgi:hypothetical protein
MDQFTDQKGIKMTIFAFSFVFPFLLVLAGIQFTISNLLNLRSSGFRTTLILGIFSALVVIIPLKGLSLARWLISANADFSIPLTAILFSRVWENASRIRLLDDRALLSSWIFGMVSGLTLYPMAMGLSGFDPYILGWEFSWLFILLMTVTFLLLLFKNRFGVVLIACILAYDLSLLESINLWDYLIDPVFVFISAAALIGRLVRKICGVPPNEKCSAD